MAEIYLLTKKAEISELTRQIITVAGSNYMFFLKSDELEFQREKERVEMVKCIRDIGQFGTAEDLSNFEDARKEAVKLIKNLKLKVRYLVR